MRQTADSLIKYYKPVFHRLFIGGTLEVRKEGAPFLFLGDGNGPSFVVDLLKKDALRKIMEDPEMNLGESYVNGEWELIQGDLGRLLSWFGKNSAGVWDNLQARDRINDIATSKANVRHHYDLGNDLYKSFLDEGMNYSCAFFNDHRMSLRDAQLSKIYTAIERADIRPGMSALDLGCGWGEFCRILSRYAGVKVTGLTLSGNQFAWAQEKRKELGGNFPAFIMEDYRVHALKNPGVYDRVVSIGMLEHVGKKNYSEFFSSIKRLLKPQGKALVHTIVSAGRTGGVSRWIDKYIFPGGQIPALPEALEAAKNAGFKIPREPYAHEGANYAETLRRWRRNFNANAHKLPPHYNNKFRRIWNFYLALSEASFDGRGNYVAQIPLEK